jgi:hypothetical protein
MTYTYKVRKVPKDSLMLVWKCEHIKKEKVPILLWKHKPIFVPQTQEWIDERYCCPCIICRREFSQ